MLSVVRLSKIVRTTPPLMSVLSDAHRLCLSCWLVLSGPVYLGDIRGWRPT